MHLMLAHHTSDVKAVTRPSEHHREHPNSIHRRESPGGRDGGLSFGGIPTGIDEHPEWVAGIETYFGQEAPPEINRTRPPGNQRTSRRRCAVTLIWLK
jgi:hypothetical protein